MICMILLDEVAVIDEVDYWSFNGKLMLTALKVSWFYFSYRKGNMHVNILIACMLIYIVFMKIKSIYGCYICSYNIHTKTVAKEYDNTYYYIAINIK